jgi:uncharacterized protein (TIGR02996 family)
MRFALFLENAEQRRRFLVELLGNPADRQAPLVFADWLDEQGRGDVAEAVRLAYGPEIAAERRKRPLLARTQAALAREIAASPHRPVSLRADDHWTDGSFRLVRAGSVVPQVVHERDYIMRPNAEGRRVNYGHLVDMVNVRAGSKPVPSYRHYYSAAQDWPLGYDNFDWREADPDHLYLIWLNWLKNRLGDRRWLRQNNPTGI